MGNFPSAFARKYVANAIHVFPPPGTVKLAELITVFACFTGFN